MTRNKTRRLGQGLVEYLVMVAMVGLLLVGAVQALRASMGEAFATVTRRLEGVGHKISGDVGPGQPAGARRIVLDETTGRFVSVPVR